MSAQLKTLEELIQELPSHLRGEVMDFVEFLLLKRRRSTGRKLRQDWANAVQTEEAYTSVELQHLALEWRTESR